MLKRGRRVNENQQTLDFSGPNHRSTYGDTTLDAKLADTSKAVLDGMDEKMTVTQTRIMKLLDCYPEGLTGSEVAFRIGLGLLSARPPITILKRAGKVFDTGLRRKNQWGKMEAVVTSSRAHADSKRIGAGTLYRNDEAVVVELLDLKQFLALINSAQHGYTSMTDIAAEIDRRVKARSDGQ